MTESLRVLMNGLIDYAGLFPPAKLPMSEAATNYARDLMGPHSHALARFICSVSRLEELSQTGAMLMPGTYATSGYQEMIDAADPWSVSCVIDTELEPALDLIDAFNAHHDDTAHGRARIDAIEMRVTGVHDIDEALDVIPEDLSVAIEFPNDAVAEDPRGYVAALAGNDATAKIRCGGVSPDLIPSPETVAAFIEACVHAQVPFKATAGLHHPVRAEQPLTYEDEPPRAVMHGFLNVFLGAALHYADVIDGAALLECLRETDPASFAFTDDRASWKDHALTTHQLVQAREAFCVSYGSCSFDEPIADLKKLKLITT